MEAKHFDILNFLSKQAEPQSEEEFPEEIKAAYQRHSTRPGSLINELEIVLVQNKNWLESKYRKYSLSPSGKIAFQKAELEFQSSSYEKELKLEELTLQVRTLQETANHFRWAEKKSNLALIFSFIVVVIEVLRFCNGR